MQWVMQGSVWRKLVKVGLLFILLVTTLTLALDWHIGHQYNDQIFSDITQLPRRKVALVLGTSKYAPSGQLNLYYTFRLQAAVRLYEAHKIDGILVSGDNGTRYYDEPTDMTQDLVEQGIPAQYITQDYAGFSTLDSLLRAQKVFNLEEYTIISQKFHCQRALFIAKAHGQDVIAYVAQDVTSIYHWRIRLREVLARVKAVIECKVLHKGPKFLGPPEAVEWRISEH